MWNPSSLINLDIDLALFAFFDKKALVTAREEPSLTASRASTSSTPLSYTSSAKPTPHRLVLILDIGIRSYQKKGNMPSNS